MSCQLLSNLERYFTGEIYSVSHYYHPRIYFQKNLIKNVSAFAVENDFSFGFEIYSISRIFGVSRERAVYKVIFDPTDQFPM